MSSGPSIGDKIDGRYELRDQLGSCASRTAFRAFDTDVEVEVALWYLRPELFPDDASRATFMAAAEQVRGLKHRHILRVFGAGIVESEAGAQANLYLTQQLGTSAELEGRLQVGGVVDPSAILRYAESLARAFDAAHAVDLHHGWLSPADVVEVAGQVKLCGVGLFAALDPRAALPLWGDATRYLAPEVVAGEASTAACDWYSLAVVLLELATGAKVQQVDHALATLAASAPEQAEALSAALAKDPALRPTRAQDLLAAIRLAWGDDEATVEDSRPITATGEMNRAPSKHALLTPGADVAMRSFLDDDDADDETGMHHGRPKELMVSEVVSSGESVSIDIPFEPLTGEDHTEITASPLLRLEALSMKPNSPVGEKLAKKEAAALGLPVKPILRSLASLGGAQGHQDLGKLAPPRAQTYEQKSNYWLFLVLALLAGAVTVTLILILTGSDSGVDSSDGPEEIEKGAVTPQSPPPTPTRNVDKRELLVLGPRCADGMAHVSEASVCIDAYEAPGRGRRPQSGLSRDEAASECAKRDLRLCTGPEWESACRGRGGSSWPYGGRFTAEICNLKGNAIEVTGARSECRSSFGVFDMSGNIAEWVAEGQIRGGSALDQTKGRCSQLRPDPAGQSAYSDVGFRCCADAIASEASSD